MLERGETEGRSVRERERQRGGLLERGKETEGRSVRERERQRGGVLWRLRDRGEEC